MAKRHWDADEAIHDLAHAHEVRLNIRELLAFITEKAGGPQVVAEEFWKVFRAGGEGSSVQANMLNNYLRLLGTFSDNADDDDALTNAEIETMAKQALLEAEDGD